MAGEVVDLVVQTAVAIDLAIGNALVIGKGLVPTALLRLAEHETDLIALGELIGDASGLAEHGRLVTPIDQSIGVELEDLVAVACLAGCAPYLNGFVLGQALQELNRLCLSLALELSRIVIVIEQVAKAGLIAVDLNGSEGDARLAIGGQIVVAELEDLAVAYLLDIVLIPAILVGQIAIDDGFEIGALIVRELGSIAFRVISWASESAQQVSFCQPLSFQRSMLLAVSPSLAFTVRTLL